MNIVDLIFQENAGHSGVAVSEGGRKVTYPDLFAAIRTTAEALAPLGVGPGVLVALCLRGGTDYIVLSLAVLLRGGVLVPIIDTAGEEEIEATCGSIGTRILFTARKLATQAGNEFRSAGLAMPVWVTLRAQGAAPDPRLLALNAAFVRFSSGTTGASKGVALSHLSIRERTDAADRALKMGRTDRVLWVLNMSFHFVVTILLFLRRGSTLVVCENDFPSSFFQTLQEGVPTFLYASPFHYSLLATAGSLPRDVFRRVRLAISTAMSLTTEVAVQFYAVYGIYPSQAYGIIEVGLPCVNLSQDPEKLLSVGTLLPGYELKLLEPDDHGRGRILIRGQGLFDAYLQPFRPADQVLQDGWFDTGDIGEVDADGYLFITGRAKNVINFCGMKVFPEEVERILDAYPGVSGSRVFGRPHPQFGQIVCAELVASEPFDLDGLRLDCYHKLAKYQVPKEFSFVQELPRTASGKIRRH